jgi:hypothetical protein
VIRYPSVARIIVIPHFEVDTSRISCEILVGRIQPDKIVIQNSCTGHGHRFVSTATIRRIQRPIAHTQPGIHPQTVRPGGGANVEISKHYYVRIGGLAVAHGNQVCRASLKLPSQNAIRNDFRMNKDDDEVERMRIRFGNFAA